jgi:hypothetical protein
MRQRMAFLLLFWLLLVPGGMVKAETPITFNTMEIDLWPEYDQPTVLVIYHIFIAPGTALPVTMTLHIPASVGDPAHIATRESDGILYNAPFKRTVSGDWSAVTITATALEVQFEYYDPGLIKNGADCSFSYEWQGEYDVNSLSIQVQQPVSATNMQITPSLGLGAVGSSGITFYNSTVGTVKAGTKFSVAMKYQKSNDNLTASNLQVQPSTPISSQTTGRAAGLNVILAWTLGGLGALLLVGGGIWYWRSSRPGSSGQARKRHTIQPKKSAVKAAVATPVESPAGDGIYCHQCGNRARDGDVFCRSCGTRLRKEEI